MVNKSERETDAERGRLEKMDTKRYRDRSRGRQELQRQRPRWREVETKTPRKPGKR